MKIRKEGSVECKKKERRDIERGITGGEKGENEEEEKRGREKRK